MKARLRGIKIVAAYYRFILIFAILSLGIVAGGAIYFRQYERRYRIEVERRIAAVAELKVNELVGWRKGHMAVANVFNNNAAFASLVRRFFNDPGDADAQRQLYDWIGKCQTSHQYLRVFLMDTQGVTRLSAPEAPPMDSPHLARDAAASLGSGQIAFLDLHRAKPDAPAHLTVIVPIFDEQNGRRPLGMLALRIDPTIYLYPFLARWPAPSRTTETLLIRREGNEVVFLNELKFQTNSALNLRIPLTNTNVVAVKAALGQEGIVVGKDYRGVMVIADVHRVPNSPWFLIAKMDAAEMYAPLRRGQWIIIAAIVVLLFSAGTGVVLIWQQSIKAQYREKFESEKRRNESEDKYRRLIDNSHDIIYTMSTDGVFTFVSPAWTVLLGHPANQVVGRPFQQFVHPDDIAECMAFIRKVIETGQRQDGVEYRMRHADGSWRWHTSSAVPLKNEAGIVVGGEGTAKDITNRKQSEEQVHTLLTESNQSRMAMMSVLEDQIRAEDNLKRLGKAIEQAAEIVMITDAHGLIQYVNPAFETVTGYTSAETLGRNPNILKSGQQDAAFYRTLWETIRSGKIWKGRFVNRNKNGALYTEEATISPVRDAAGAIINYVAVKRDITAELDIQAQLNQAQKMEAVGRLAGGVAHDFNNILQIILGNVELALAQAGPDNPTRPDLEEVQIAGRRAADLTNQLLGFARKQTITPRKLDLNKTVAGMLKMLRRLIGENIEIVWTPQEGLWPIKIDPVQVDQILVNLCVNARDVIDGTGTVHIATENICVDKPHAARHEGVAPGDYVLLTVSDTGHGMDKETQSKIFEPFFTTKAVGKGTGLGLATVYGIVQQNQGHIGVYSEPGMGATLKIYLPRHTSGDAAPAAESPAQAIAQGYGTVLLVEDDITILNMSGRMLRKLGYTVLLAGSPEAALRIVDEHSNEIQLLVTDVVMPGMNGHELAGRLKESHPDLKCLFMSGFTADIIARQGILEASNHFIQKPFSMKDLAAKVAQVLAGTQDT